jgi:hypothetical protein
MKQPILYGDFFSNGVQNNKYHTASTILFFLLTYRTFIVMKSILPIIVLSVRALIVSEDKILIIK